MAGLGAKKFPAFSKLTSDDVNGYLSSQVIMRFATTSARDAAFGGTGEFTLAEGMTCYIDADNTIYTYDGSNWVKMVSASTPPAMEYITSGVLSGTSVNITNCFSTAFNNYLMTLDTISLSGAGDIYYQWLTGTTPLAGAGYMWAVQGWTINSNTNNQQAFSQTIGYLGITNGAAVAGAKVANGTFTIFSPMSASDRQAIIGQVSCFAGDWATRTVMTQYNGPVNPRDGIRLFTNSGSVTFSGTYRIYGYRN